MIIWENNCLNQLKHQQSNLKDIYKIHLEINKESIMELDMNSISFYSYSVYRG